MEVRRLEPWEEEDDKVKRETHVGLFIKNEYNPDLLLTFEELTDLHSEIFKFIIKELHNQYQEKIQS